MTALGSLGKGWRTLTACASFIVAGVLAVGGAVDLTPLVALFVEDPKRLGAAMVLLGLFFGGLRFISNTPIFKPRHADADVPDPEDPGLKPRCDVGA